MRALVAAAVAAAVFAATAQASPPTGNAKGLALLARVLAAYRHVPGVSVTGAYAGTFFGYVTALRNGNAVAVEVRAPFGNTFIRRLGGPTYELASGKNCWRAVPDSDPQSIADLGQPFGLEPNMRVGAPRRIASGWELPVRYSKGSSSGTFMYVVDGRTLLFRSARTVTGGSVLQEMFRPLTKAPAIPQPKPRC
jgi:hypothetical protein